MKALRLFLGMILIATLSVFVAGCKKDKTATVTSNPTTADNTTVSQDNDLADKTFEDIHSIANEAMKMATKSAPLDTVFMGPCVQIMLDLTVMPYKLTVDFGTTNCLCDDGKTRRGKIIVTFNGPYWDSATVITENLQNYYVNDNWIQGTKTVTNLGHNTAGHPIFSVVVVNGKIIKANNGGTITWASTRNNEWISGYTTAIWWDDVYLITGTANGVASNGKSYTMTITNPLKYALNCYWIKSGTINIQVQNWPLITLDYGDGTCDDKATITALGQTYNITI